MGNKPEVCETDVYLIIKYRLAFTTIHLLYPTIQYGCLDVIINEYELQCMSY